MTAPAAPAPPSHPGPRSPSRSAARLAVPLLGLLGGVQVLDPMVANTALVSASRALRLSGATQALAASISTLALAATVISAGLAADRLGRRRVLLAALVLTVLGDLLAAAAPAAPVFLLGRAVAGVGLGAVFSAAYGFVRTVVPKDRLGAALGVFGALGGVLLVVLAPLAGALTSASWRLAFLIVPALCALAVPAALAVLPNLPGQAPSAPGGERDGIDWAGQVLVAVGVVAVLFGLSRASTSLTAPSCWAPVLAGLAALAGFAVVENRTAHPVFPIRLFRGRLFVAAVVTGIGWNFAQAVGQLQVSNLWQYVDRYQPFAVSLRQMPLLLASIAAAVVVGRLLSSGGSLRIAALGCALLAASFLMLGFVRAGTSYWYFLPALCLLGVGLSAVSVPQSQLFVSQAPPEAYGAVVSSRTTVGQLGYAVGLAGSSALIDRLTDGGIVTRLRGAGVAPADYGAALDAVGNYVRTGSRASTTLAQQAVAAAGSSYLSAFRVAMLLTAAVLAAVGALAYVLLGGSRGGAAPPAEAYPRQRAGADPASRPPARR